MTTNPTPSTTPPEVIKRRYRIFLAVESVVVLIFPAFTYIALATQSVIAALIITALGMWLVITLPIAFLYLIGKPIVFSLAPLFDSAEARAYRRELKQRPLLDDDAFAEQFYADRPLEQEIAIRLRKLCMSNIDPLLVRVQPKDLFYLAFEEMDVADLIFEVEKEFGLAFAPEDIEPLVGTFDWLLGAVKKAAERQETPVTDSTPKRSYPL
ncbi:MAG TPA: hypothetical protein VGZ25_11145 [Gemmataceae bacterium]|nr:hypothetical protein [Gemmataceae bacterium]